MIQKLKKIKTQQISKQILVIHIQFSYKNNYLFTINYVVSPARHLKWKLLFIVL